MHALPAGSALGAAHWVVQSAEGERVVYLSGPAPIGGGGGGTGGGPASAALVSCSRAMELAPPLLEADAMLLRGLRPRGAADGTGPHHHVRATSNRPTHCRARVGRAPATTARTGRDTAVRVRRIASSSTAVRRLYVIVNVCAVWGGGCDLCASD